jgi:hypothetical protein
MLFEAALGGCKVEFCDKSQNSPFKELKPPRPKSLKVLHFFTVKKTNKQLRGVGFYGF